MSAEATTAFEGEAENTRDRIAATIDELQDRLNPRRIVGDAVGSMQTGGAEMINNGVGLLKSHPAAAIAAGLLLGAAVLGRNKLQGARVDLGSEHESYSDFDDDYRTDFSASKAERFALLRNSGGNTTITNNPVVSILVGLAAGALIGLIFPETEAERRLLGTSGAKLAAAGHAAIDSARAELTTARAKVSDVADHAKHAVQSVVGAAKQEFGQTPAN